MKILANYESLLSASALNSVCFINDQTWHPPTCTLTVLTNRDYTDVQKTVLKESKIILKTHSNVM